MYDGKNLSVSQSPLSPLKQTLYLFAAVFLYGVNTALAIACEYMDWIAGLVVLMLAFVTIFLFAVSISFMFLRRAVPLRLIQDSDVIKWQDHETAVEEDDGTNIDKEKLEMEFVNDNGEKQATKF